MSREKEEDTERQYRSQKVLTSLAMRTCVKF